MSEIDKPFLLARLALYQQEAEQDAQRDYDQRVYATFQTARNVLRSIAHGITDPEIVEAINKLADTLDESRTRL